MNSAIFLRLESLSKRYKELDHLLKTNSSHLDYKKIHSLSKEHSDLFNIYDLFSKWKKNKKNIKDLKKLLTDKTLGELASIELQEMKIEKNILKKKISNILIPQEDKKLNSCYLEIRAATGGDEAAIFSGDLCRMYIRYSEIRNWKIEIINMHTGDHGGYKEIILKVTGNNVVKRLKFESGGHRVQRIPKTESQGRVHTSSCTVAIMPVISKSEKVEIRTSDLKIDTFRSSGAGGQHVNTTDSAVRITHIPTGYVVECQDERSQHKNKEKALSVLSSKIYAAKVAKINLENSLKRKDLLGTGSRSDRNRTYNFPQNRVSDHRINLTIYRLNEVLEGKLDLLIEPILQEYYSNILSEKL